MYVFLYSRLKLQTTDSISTHIVSRDGTQIVFDTAFSLLKYSIS